MKAKLSLSLDDLAVESFTPDPGSRPTIGTVRAHGDPGGDDPFLTAASFCYGWPCGGDGPSGAASCGATCAITGYDFCEDNPCRHAA